MARGWESKSIEAQQEEAARAKGLRLREPTPAEREAAARRRTLELARAQVESELRGARTPAHREMLHRALRNLDRQLTNSTAD